MRCAWLYSAQVRAAERCKAECYVAMVIAFQKGRQFLNILLPHIIRSIYDWFNVLKYVWSHAEMARTSACCMALKNADSFGSVGISEPRSC